MLLRLYIIEPHDLRRRLLSDSVQAALDVELAGAGHPGTEDWPAADSPDTSPPAGIDFLLVSADVFLQEREAIRRLCAAAPEAGIVLYDTVPNLSALLAARELPLRGFLLFNHLSEEDFVTSLNVMARGGAVIEPLTAALLLDHLRQNNASRRRGGDLLTIREEEVIEYVRRGMSNKEIAREMSVSLGTVRAHLRSIFRKLGVASRAGAVMASLTAERRDQAG
jgi:two-component system nitrate/nitrite response regulator NarL